MHRIATKLRNQLKLVVLRCLALARRLTLGRYGIAILTQSENGLLLVPTSDVMVGRRLCFSGSYDPELLHCLLARCGPTSRVLFVGAHVGAFAIPTAKKVRSVVAVEANPATFELLQRNVVLNHLQNVEIYNFAAGNRNGDVNFLASGLNSGGSGIQMGEWNEWAYMYDKPKTIQVQMKRLDDVFHADIFDLIVMDIEGSEALALQGMNALVERTNGLIVEVFEHHLRCIARINNEEFLSLAGLYFDEAFILAEKPRSGEAFSSGPYPKSAFSEMMLECSRRGMANVMFLKKVV